VSVEVIMVGLDASVVAVGAVMALFVQCAEH
jgi:hypothetical protein